MPSGAHAIWLSFNKRLPVAAGMYTSVTACMACMTCQHAQVWVQRRVLRLREGDALEVCDGMGSIAEGRFAGLTHNNRAFVETTGDIRQVLAVYSSLFM